MLSWTHEGETKLLTDRELIDRIIEGDPGAADLFVIRFARFVWAILVRDLRLATDAAEEIYQDVFLHLWEDDYRRLRLWSSQGDFARYLAPIVRNRAVDHLRAAGRRANLEHAEDEDLADPIVTEPTPEEQAMVQEQRREVERAVRRLAHRDRELYRRRYEQQRSYREIAEAMGMTVSNVGVALARMEARLARIIGVDGAHSALHPEARPGVRSARPGTSDS